uniref:Uncharacterized protein n=1 Tax=Rhizophora mucronata TaxID=61149 RepID=A0A2P2PNI7_RHIMU
MLSLTSLDSFRSHLFLTTRLIARHGLLMRTRSKHGVTSTLGMSQ